MKINRLLSRYFKYWIWLVVVVVYLVILTKNYTHRDELQVIFDVQPGSLSIPVADKRVHQSHKNESDQSPGDEWPEVYTNRRATLVNTCKDMWRRQHRLNVGENGLREHFSMDQKHGFVYCDIPKVGSTFWKRVLQITSGKKKKSNPFDISARAAHDGTLEQFNGRGFDQIHQALFSSTKFLFVREPYSRLFSCYIDKVFTPTPAYLNLRKHILEISRGKLSENLANETCAVHVTFSDFVKFVIHSVANGKWTDYHFLPMYDICRPCEIQYDIVGKMETFMKDVEFILEQKGVENLIELNQERSDSDAILDIVDSVFAERRGIEKCMSFGKGLSFVWKKAIIRGILSKDEIMPQMFLEGGNFSKEHFKNAMNEAYKRSAKKKGRLENRQESLVEAFMSISKEDLKQYHELFKPDFDIFGYELEPSNIFSPNMSKTGQSFFA